MFGSTILVFVYPRSGNNLPFIPFALFPYHLIFLRLVRFSVIQGTCDTRSERV
jgi:hypothetical protein